MQRGLFDQPSHRHAHARRTISVTHYVLIYHTQSSIQFKGVAAMSRACGVEPSASPSWPILLRSQILVRQFFCLLREITELKSPSVHDILFLSLSFHPFPSFLALSLSSRASLWSV